MLCSTSGSAPPERLGDNIDPKFGSIFKSSFVRNVGSEYTETFGLLNTFRCQIGLSMTIGHGDGKTVPGGGPILALDTKSSSFPKPPVRFNSN